jgi:IS30 family transposase
MPYHHFSTEERYVISHLAIAGFSLREIGRRHISEKEVALVVKKLNNRPRKCLNYQTPYEVYRQAIRGAL